LRRPRRSLRPGIGAKDQDIGIDDIGEGPQAGARISRQMLRGEIGGMDRAPFRAERRIGPAHRDERGPDIDA